MEFKQLEAFVKVVELKSFSKAAVEIYVFHPSISAYINLLEKELQITLLNRSTKVISPTDAGKIL
ncbi:LysR family transcriptional regulator [Microbacteriaceae bacterium 4G12]